MTVPVPCPPGWAEEAAQCWNELQQLKKIISQTMAPEIQKLQIAINNISTQITNITNGTAPIMGVTNGSNPAPGTVGEHIERGGTWNFTGTVVGELGQITTTQPFPAGDWLAFAYAYVEVVVSGTQFWLTHPAPGGSAPPLISDSMGAVIAQNAPEHLTLVGPAVRVSLITPVPFTFNANVNNYSALGNPGVFDLRVSAWRMR